MASLDEIDRRVEETDTPRTAKRRAAAREVGELAQRRAAIVAALDEIEHQLGDVLIGTEDVISDDELARFTDVAKSDLARWRAAARSARKTTSRKRPKQSSHTKHTADKSTARTSTANTPATTPPTTVDSGGASATVSEPVPASVA